MNTFFWGLAGEDLRWFSLAIFGAALEFFSRSGYRDISRNNTS